MGPIARCAQVHRVKGAQSCMYMCACVYIFNSNSRYYCKNKGLDPSIIGEPVDLFATCLEILPKRYSFTYFKSAEQYLIGY